MDTTAILALLLDRVVDGAEGRLLVERCRHDDIDAAFDAAFAA
jgi:hypothetical protein